MNWITVVGFIAAFCTTFSFLPQAIKTVRTKNTEGISLHMYVLFTTGTILWFIYGVTSHTYPVMIANAITTIFAVIILYYKIKY